MFDQLFNHVEGIHLVRPNAFDPGGADRNPKPRGLSLHLYGSEEEPCSHLDSGCFPRLFLA